PYRARFYFDAAEEKAAQDENKGVFAKIGSFGKTAGAAITGAEELRDYELKGFEKVMLLDYKALTYLLTGDYEKAYNVARRAIDTQQEEYEKFQKELAKIEEEKDEVRDSGKLTGEKKAETAQLVKVINGTFTKEQLAKATKVKSAYVNPFGDYMNGMILEIDSTVAHSGTDTGSVKTAYKKAYELNKTCVACREGESARESGIPKGMKVVQVILADGFSPSRVEKTQEIKTKTYNGGVNYSDLQLHPSQLHRATVSIGGQTKQLSNLTNMESLIARDELDRLPWRRAMMLAAIIKQTAAAAAQEVGNEKGNAGLALTATLLGAVSRAAQHADTRSWMSLPNQILVARLIVPQNQHSVTLNTFGAGGKKLASRTVQLKGTDSTVIYATSYDGQLNVGEAQAKKSNLES
ncbi:MAG: hypothetical protein LUC43_02040, partial [Burkholderiales bacterium]|nr:hypothetical protein [Burkholderiales bacterium]